MEVVTNTQLKYLIDLLYIMESMNETLYQKNGKIDMANYVDSCLMRQCQ